MTTGRDPVCTKQEADSLAITQLSAIGQKVVLFVTKGPWDLTDSPISFMENLKEHVRYEISQCRLSSNENRE